MRDKTRQKAFPFLSPKMRNQQFFKTGFSFYCDAFLRKPRRTFQTLLGYFWGTASFLYTRFLSQNRFTLLGNREFLVNALNQEFCGLPIHPKTGRDIPLSCSHHLFSWFQAHFPECVSQAPHPHKPSRYKVRQDRHRL